LVAREPGSAELLHFRGEARRQRADPGDAELALADLEAALRTGQAPAVSHRSLGHLRKSTNQPGAAGDAWRAYLERAPQAPDAALIRQSLEELKP
jgi:regulator of sirC expression with transglutaminase-like and TPR domain